MPQLQVASWLVVQPPGKFARPITRSVQFDSDLRHEQKLSHMSKINGLSSDASTLRYFG
jgi:hypothetical protein